MTNRAKAEKERYLQLMHQHIPDLPPEQEPPVKGRYGVVSDPPTSAQLAGDARFQATVRRLNKSRGPS